MAPVQCTSFSRKHERPVNSRCFYFKTALKYCLDNRIPREDYKLHLPELDVLDESKNRDLPPGTYGTPTKSQIIF